MSDTKIACAEHCAYCFDMLIEELTNVQTAFDWTSLPLGHSKMPVFVTWYKRSSKRKNDDLRGCLGTFSQELPITLGLKKYAVMSAMNDKRFSPILVEELSALKVQISLLHSFTRCKSWDDWDLGTHGITIQFEAPHSHKTYNATYLPEVARQQRWNKVATLDHLVTKAGWSGNAASVHKLVVTKYQSCKYNMSWNEFLQYIKADRVLIGRVMTLRNVTTARKYSSMTGKDPVFAVREKNGVNSNGHHLNGMNGDDVHNHNHNGMEEEESGYPFNEEEEEDHDIDSDEDGDSGSKGKSNGCNGLYPAIQRGLGQGQRGDVNNDGDGRRGDSTSSSRDRWPHHKSKVMTASHSNSIDTATVPPSSSHHRHRHRQHHSNRHRNRNHNSNSARSVGDDVHHHTRWDRGGSNDDQFGSSSIYHRFEVDRDDHNNIPFQSQLSHSRSHSAYHPLAAPIHDALSSLNPSFDSYSRSIQSTDCGTAPSDDMAYGPFLARVARKKCVSSYSPYDSFPISSYKESTQCADDEIDPEFEEKSTSHSMHRPLTHSPSISPMQFLIGSHSQCNASNHNQLQPPSIPFIPSGDDGTKSAASSNLYSSSSSSTSSRPPSASSSKSSSSLLSISRQSTYSPSTSLSTTPEEPKRSKTRSRMKVNATSNRLEYAQYQILNEEDYAVPIESEISEPEILNLEDMADREKPPRKRLRARGRVINRRSTKSPQTEMERESGRRDEVMEREDVADNDEDDDVDSEPDIEGDGDHNVYNDGNRSSDDQDNGDGDDTERERMIDDLEYSDYLLFEDRDGDDVNDDANGSLYGPIEIDAESTQ